MSRDNPSPSATPLEMALLPEEPDADRSSILDWIENESRASSLGIFQPYSMCSVFQFKKQTFRPGREVTAQSKRGIVRPVWAGFARNESLDWWLQKGGVLLDLPINRFAERSDQTGRLVWDDVPDHLVLRGLLDVQSGQPLLKVVTRAASLEELERFQHPRMPLLGDPLFELLPEVMSGSSEKTPQGELF